LSRFTSEKQHHFPGEQQFNDDIVMGTRNFEKPLSLIEFLPAATLSYMNIDYWLFSSFSDLFFFFLYDFHVRALLLVAVQWVTDSPPA
jgi:hypothetical protein